MLCYSYLHKLARKTAEGEGGKRLLPWRRRSRIVGIPRAKWKWGQTGGWTEPRSMHVAKLERGEITMQLR